jgi:hypothetical protein
MKNPLSNSVIIGAGVVVVLVLAAIAWHMFSGPSAGTKLHQGDYMSPPPAASARKSNVAHNTK